VESLVSCRRADGMSVHMRASLHSYKHVYEYVRYVWYAGTGKTGQRTLSLSLSGVEYVRVAALAGQNA